jgi:peptide-methionine (S)-S-oxide reductase
MLDRGKPLVPVMAVLAVGFILSGCSERDNDLQSKRGDESRYTRSTCVSSAPGESEHSEHSSDPAMSGHESKPAKVETATFAAGCFWGVEHRFRQVEGVIQTAVGFMGGVVDDPSYKQVCTGRTGHAEVVQLQYDPSVVSYDELLDVFWASHDPTSLNRQGWDVGAQYRSAVFFHTPQQEAAAKASKEKLEQSGKYSGKIVTEITPASTFWKAEEYHQQYLAKHGKISCASTVRD